MIGRDQLIHELLLRWEERRERGEPVDLKELCSEHPDLLEEVLRQIKALRRLDGLLEADESSDGVHSSWQASAADAAVPSLPQSIGRYKVLEELGRGGMGVVYRVLQPELKREAALKMVLTSEYAGRPAFERFRNEAEAIARLDHPNIVKIFEVNQHDGLPYLVQEFVDGGSLAQCGTALRAVSSIRENEAVLEGEAIREGEAHWEGEAPAEPPAAPHSSPPPRRAASLIATLAEAMHYAHQRGIIHRDLKPTNILITRDGIPKITDFGLAKLLHSDSSLTKTGAILGTPSYMAPEQAAGLTREAGPHTDVYSLGAILYQLLTARPPFEGDSAHETVHQVQFEEPPPPSRLNAEVPSDLERICLKCLEKDPADRYKSAAALADDLECFLNDEPVQAKSVSLADRLRRWARQPERMRDAGYVAVVLNLLLPVWILVLTPLSAWLSNHAMTRPLEFAVTATLLIFGVHIPLVWSGIRAIEQRRNSVYLGLGLAALYLIMVVLCLTPLPLGFGGVYDDVDRRSLVFPLLALLGGVQLGAFWIAVIGPRHVTR